jgi:hypothetical protein
VTTAVIILESKYQAKAKADAQRLQSSPQASFLGKLLKGVLSERRM